MAIVLVEELLLNSLSKYFLTIKKLQNMPVPLIPLIAAGAQLGGNVINAATQAKMNKSTQRWNEKMYGRQREDALADWNMQNEYNSPENQMERLKQAGLNPNLIYGNGNAVDTAQSMPRQSSVQSWSPHAPQVDMSGVANGLMDIYDAKLKEAQVDNLAVQKELMDQEKRNKAAQEFKIYADTNKSISATAGQDIKNKYAPQIAEMSLEGMKASIEKTGAQTQKTYLDMGLAVQANERAEIKQGMSLKVAAQQIINMRINALKTQQDTLLSEAKTENTKLQWLQIDETIKNLRTQGIVLDESWRNIQSRTALTDEQLRLLESRPDWTDEKNFNTLSDILKNLLGNFTRQGTSVNPKTYQGWKKP